MLETFGKFLVSKGCKVKIVSNNKLTARFKRLSFNVYILPQDVKIKFLVEYDDKSFCIHSFSECHIEVSDSACCYLFSRKVGVGFFENIYSVIRFMLGLDDILLSEVQYLVELNDKNSFHEGFPIHIVDNYPSLSMYGKHLGYRLSCIKRQGLADIYYDVGLDLSRGILDKFLISDIKFIVPLESVNGTYKNKNDARLDIKEIKSTKQLSKIVKLL